VSHHLLALGRSFSRRTTHWDRAGIPLVAGGGIMLG